MPKKKIPDDMLEFFRMHGRKGGKKAAAGMTAEQRSERARTAVKAREVKRAAGTLAKGPKTGAKKK
jgi:hypothetical protein